MSFLRHKQIYRPMVRKSGQAGAVATPPRSHRPMSLRPAIPRRVALLHCSPPLHQSTAMVMPIAGQRQPPLSRGWGILDRRNGGNFRLFRIFGAVMVPALKGIGLRVRRAAHALAEAETQHVRTSRA